jgi:hypothetical protein
LQINYHMLYEMYWLWEELILESGLFVLPICIVPTLKIF